MGCDVIVGGGGSEARERVRALFAERERTLSRFDPASELSRVNASAAPALLVSEVLAATIADALRAHRLSGGLVDPTLERSLVEAGYDRDLGLLDSTVSLSLAPARRGRGSAVRLSGRLLRRPAGLRLDLAGVAKGRTVDEALALLDGPGFVSAGGDLAVRGRLAVDLPGGGAIHLTAGGMATSGTGRRRWTRDGALAHHLIDPRTGGPSTSRWQSVTVAAGSCLAADVAAKTAFLLGDTGPAWLEERGLVGRFLEPSGAVVETRSWPTTREAAA